MTLVLHSTWTERLAELPETGMGYQVVALEGLAVRAEHVVIANGAVALDVARRRHAVREGLEFATQQRIERTLVSNVREARFEVRSRSQAIAANIIEARAAVTGPANAAPVEDSANDERFLRFSAYEHDIRINADGSVKPGTYVTTYEDGIAHVRTGMDAVRRYALPNPDPAIHRFHLYPTSAIRVQRGTSQPALGQPGGGVEVILTGGAPVGTKYKQDKLPLG